MTRYPSLREFLRSGRKALRHGPVALIFAEDAERVTETLRHHLDSGFAGVVLLRDSGVPLPGGLDGAPVHVVDHPGIDAASVAATITRLQAAAPADTWFFWCYNAEFLFFPFRETRRVGEMLRFHAQERRRAMIGFTVDLYPPAPSQGPLCLRDAHMDRTGYFAQAREGPDGPRDRQLDFYGGLRWRFEEHIAPDRRRIDRVALFRSRPGGLSMRADATFSEEEYNTYECPWHHNLTCAVASFRAAKALSRNPGSRRAIDGFRWCNSVPFEWSSRQLLDLGLMETGQWF